MTTQYKEELAHAQVIFDYLIERGGRVMLEPIDEAGREVASTARRCSPTRWPTSRR